jgi:hypothetical protein
MCRLLRAVLGTNLREHRIERRAIEEATRLHDRTNPPRVRDVGQRVRIEKYEIRNLPNGKPSNAGV